MSGTLYLVATPIGNLNDLSPRVKSIFEKVDLILAEDTRVTIKLLNHLSVKKRMLSCHDFNEKSRLKIISEFNNLNQSIALVSDAGTPLISDPGYEIVRQAITQNMDIIPIPGPALVYSLSRLVDCHVIDLYLKGSFPPSKVCFKKN